MLFKDSQTNIVIDHPLMSDQLIYNTIDDSLITFDGVNWTTKKLYNNVIQVTNNTITVDTNETIINAHERVKQITITNITSSTVYDQNVVLIGL